MNFPPLPFPFLPLEDLDIEHIIVVVPLPRRLCFHPSLWSGLFVPSICQFVEWSVCPLYLSVCGVVCLSPLSVSLWIGLFVPSICQFVEWSVCRLYLSVCGLVCLSPLSVSLWSGLFVPSICQFVSRILKKVMDEFQSKGGAWFNEVFGDLASISYNSCQFFFPNNRLR